MPHTTRLTLTCSFHSKLTDETMSRHTTSMNGGRSRPLALLVFLSGACESPPASSPVEIPFIAEYSTERLRIATDFTAELCAGNIALMDAQIRWMEQEIDGQRENPTWIYLYADGETIDACPEPDGGVALGCWDAPVVYTTWDAASHELVHAYLSEVNDLVPIVLREGAAVALEGNIIWSNANNRGNLRSFLFEEFPRVPFSISPAGTSCDGSTANMGGFEPWGSMDAPPKEWARPRSRMFFKTHSGRS